MTRYKVRSGRVLAAGFAVLGVGCSGTIGNGGVGFTGAPAGGDVDIDGDGIPDVDGNGDGVVDPPGPPGASTPGNDEAGGSAPSACVPGQVAIGSAPIRHLNRREYNNTIRDLLGITTAPANAFPSDDNPSGFDTNANTLVASRPLIEGYLSAAEALAAAVDVEKLVPCVVATTGATACASRFATDFGKRAYRRPLAGNEIKVLTDVYARATTNGRAHADALRLVLRAVLQSPQFVYRMESSAVTDLAGVRPVAPHEMASRLSYFLWSSMPDAELTAAADARRLGTPAEIATQARRMLADPKAHSTVSAFHEQWLTLTRIDGLSKDAALFPKFASIQPFLKEETQRYTDHVFWNTDATVGRLFSSDFSFLNKTLAQFYGVSGPTSDAFAMTPLPGGQRRGLLTQAGWLGSYSHADRSSPTKRGNFVRGRLLCLEPPPPPANVGPLPNATANTVRERLAEHATNPACGVCHRLIDPIGLGLEGYDGIGAFRSSEDGRPVDVTGEINDAEDATGAFSGAIELGQRLAQSQTAQRCVARQWFEFAVNRGDNDADACSLQAAQGRLVETGGDMRELLLAIVATDSFRNILVEEGVSP